AGNRVKGGLETGARTCSGNTHSVSSVVARPIADRFGSSKIIKGAVVVKHMNVCRIESIDINERAVEKLKVVCVSVIGMASEQNRIAFTGRRARGIGNGRNALLPGRAFK